eukprot:9485871-Lingulodinium_polyedra.AAC.1
MDMVPLEAPAHCLTVGVLPQDRLAAVIVVAWLKHQWHGRMLCIAVCCFAKHIVIAYIWQYAAHVELVATR